MKKGITFTDIRIFKYQILNDSNKTRTFAIHNFAIDWKLKP